MLDADLLDPELVAGLAALIRRRGCLLIEHDGRGGYRATCGAGEPWSPYAYLGELLVDLARLGKAPRHSVFVLSNTKEEDY